jgi:hypothetical protein
MCIHLRLWAKNFDAVPASTLLKLARQNLFTTNAESLFNFERFDIAVDVN